MSILARVKSFFGADMIPLNPKVTNTLLDADSIKAELLDPSVGATPSAVEAYANMTDSQKVIELEKAVTQQGEYLKAFKESMKIINRRNTMAIIELNVLVNNIKKIHPDTEDIIAPVMAKCGEILDFKKTYDISPS